MTDRSHQFRCGGRVLSLLSSTLHGLILCALADGPVRLADLQARLGAQSDEVLRGNIGNLIGIGALEKRRPDGDPDLLDNELTDFGRALLSVASALDAWLARAPEGTLEIESERAKKAVRALVSGWGSTMLRALAVRPLSLRELDELLVSFSHPAIERRVTAMCGAGLLKKAAEGDGEDPTYAVTEWLREGAAPLLAAIRCERLHLQHETAPLMRIDVESLLLLAVPLLGPGVRDGSSQIAVDLSDGSRSGPAGVRIEAADGGIVSCVSKLDDEPSDWAFGSAGAWLEAIVAGQAGGLETGGADGLSAVLIENLHDRLYAGARTVR